METSTSKVMTPALKASYRFRAEVLGLSDETTLKLAEIIEQETGSSTRDELLAGIEICSQLLSFDDETPVEAFPAMVEEVGSILSALIAAAEGRAT